MPPGGPRFLASAGFGYVRKYMTLSMQAVRAIGTVILLAGAWFQILWALPPGVIVILLGWLRGVLVPARMESA